MVLAHALYLEFVLISHISQSQHPGFLHGLSLQVNLIQSKILLLTQNQVLVEQVRMHQLFLTCPCKIWPYIFLVVLLYRNICNLVNCAGRGAKEANLYTEIAEGIYSYSVTRHHHAIITATLPWSFQRKDSITGCWVQSCFINRLCRRGNIQFM